MIAIDLSKQQTLNADPKAIQKINFTGNLDRGRNADGQIINANTTFSFHYWTSQKKTFWIFHKEL